MCTALVQAFQNRGSRPGGHRGRPPATPASRPRPTRATGRRQRADLGSQGVGYIDKRPLGVLEPARVFLFHPARWSFVLVAEGVIIMVIVAASDAERRVVEARKEDRKSRTGALLGDGRPPFP